MSKYIKQLIVKDVNVMPKSIKYKQFERMPSYKIIDNMYDNRKDFIILGLCGKIGSGVSTVAEILEKNFGELQLASPGYDHSYDTHEYRILYTYASKNWIRFYKIRTSALITRHILAEPSDPRLNPAQRFIDFLNELDSEINLDDENLKQKLDKAFFAQNMEFDLKAAKTQIEGMFDSDHENVQEDEMRRLLSAEAVKQRYRQYRILLHSEMGEHTGAEEPDATAYILFDYDEQKSTCIFSNTELSKMFDIYAKYRRNKEAFNNSYWFWILKQYIFQALPDWAEKLWEEVRSISKGLDTQAKQCLGNNLRIGKKTYLEDDSFEKDGYACLAEEINLAIKVFRAYQLLRRKNQRIQWESDTQIYRPEKRKSAGEEEIRTAIVIDSIKNPYESMYLKERYSNYYLIGIYTEDTERRRRLRTAKHLSDDDIRAMDLLEQNSEFKKCIAKLKQNSNDTDVPKIIRHIYEQLKRHTTLIEQLAYVSPFVFQNVSQCLDSADIFVNNCEDNKSYTILKKTMLRYVSLIINPGLVLPTPVERCMQIAYAAMLNSGCISRQVGAVITDREYHLLSIGWNQQPENQLPCLYRDLCELSHHWALDGYSDYENDTDPQTQKFQSEIARQVTEFFDTDICPLTGKGKAPCYCFKDYYNTIKNERNQVHTRSLHAEETAFLNLGASNLRAKGGVLFTTSSPCELCSKKAMYMGISKIYYVEPYSGISHKHVLSIGERKHRPAMILFTGATGTAYSRLYMPLMPRKDENEMWLGAKMDGKLEYLEQGETLED